VKQSQDKAPASSQTSQVLTSFHVDRDKWQRFGDLAKAHNRSRGAEVRELIDRALAQHEQAA
jgi:hypothetical protein